MRRGFGLLSFLGITAACCAAAPTTQRAAATQQASMNAWLTAAADPQPTVRDTAREALFGLTPDELPSLRDAVSAAAPLRPAQVAVVRDTVLHVLARAALQKLPTVGESMMGINLMEPLKDRLMLGIPSTPESLGPVPVYGVLPGFAADRYLRAGDLILALVIERQPHWVRTREELISVVRLLRTGTPVTVWLQRSGQPLAVTFNLDPKPGFGTGNPILEQEQVQTALENTLTEVTAAAEEMLARDFPATGE